MTVPDLKLVTDGDGERCGAPTTDGSPCQRVVASGTCWQHSEGGYDGPEAPEHLGEYGRECWRHHVTDCQQLGVWDQVDTTVLEKACEVYEMGRICWASAKKGPNVPGRDGSVKKNPAMGKFLECIKEYRQYAKEIARLKAKATPSGSSPEGIERYL